VSSGAVARQRQSGSAYHVRPTDSLQHADLPLRALRLKGAPKKSESGTRASLFFIQSPSLDFEYDQSAL